MRIRVSTLDTESAALLEAQIVLPLWARSSASAWYGRCYHLTAHKSGQIVGVWTVPLTIVGEREVASRSCRLLPYAAPVVLSRGNLQRRRVVEALFGELTKRVAAIDLPLAPGFVDTGAFLRPGVQLHWRHTHVINSGWEMGGSSVVRNHIRHASRTVAVRVRSDAGSFKFDRSIVGETQEGLSRRSGFGNYLLERGGGITVEATAGERTVGQAFVAFGDGVAYLMHSWFDRSAVRGVPSLLIDRAVREAVLRGFILDLEGSVLPGVDEFFCSLEACIVPYCYLVWEQSQT